jgi:hypothetical protein
VLFAASDRSLYHYGPGEDKVPRDGLDPSEASEIAERNRRAMEEIGEIEAVSNAYLEELRRDVLGA